MKLSALMKLNGSLYAERKIEHGQGTTSPGTCRYDTERAYS